MYKKILLIITFFIAMLFAGVSPAHAATSPDKMMMDSLPTGIAHNMSSSMSTSSSALINQINALNSQILNINKVSGKSSVGKVSTAIPNTTKLQIAVKARKQAALKLMRENPRAFFAVKISPESRATLPREIQSNVEQAVTLEGTIDVLAIDDFVHKTTRHLYYLNVGRERLEFFPAGNMLMLRSGTRAKVNGYRLDNVVVALNDSAHFQIMGSVPPPESVGDQKTLVILIDFLDSGPHPFTAAQAGPLVFNGQFQNFMKEQSYNKVSFSGDVVGWYRAQCNFLPENCYPPTVYDPDLLQYLSQNNINLHNYIRIVYLLNSKNFFGGYSYVGASDHIVGTDTYHFSESTIGAIPYYSEPSAWGVQPFPWTNLDFLLAHEVGHGLGVMHANGWDCENQALYGDCLHIEYGNFFDTMGNVGNSLDFNAFYKELLGWIAPVEENQITTTGDYSIGALESASSTQKLAKIQMQGSNQKPFYLEYRRAIGFDSNLASPELASNQNGLFVNRIISLPYWNNPFPRLIDASPTSLGWYEDTKQTTLNGSNTLVDVGRGITIGPIKDNNSTGIDFRVKIEPPVCERHLPVFNSTYFSDQVQSGGSGYFSFDYTNQDTAGCPPSNFIVTVMLPSDWSYYTYPIDGGRTLLLSPDENGWGAANFNVPAKTPPGVYTGSVTIRNNDSGNQITRNFSVNIVPPPVIDSVTPSSGLPDTLVTLTGSGFSSLANNGAVSINGSNTYSLYSLVVENDNTITFHFPTSMNSNNCPNNTGCPIPTPTDLYSILLWSGNLYSNYAYFQVTSPFDKEDPTVTVSSSTLNLVYDNNNQESLLKSITMGTITTENSPFVVLSGYNPFQIAFFRNGEQTSANSYRNIYTILPALQNNTIPAHTTVNYFAVASMNPQELLSGSYTTSLQNIYNATGHPSPVPPNTTNAVTIVGEISPYINSVNSPVNAGGVVAMNGVRLTNISEFVIDGDSLNSCVGIICTQSSDGTTFSFTLPSSVTSGWHNLQLRNSTGLSNRVWFEVSSGRPSLIPEAKSKSIPSALTSDDLSASVINSLNNLVNMAKAKSMTAEISNSINLLLKNLKTFGGN